MSEYYALMLIEVGSVAWAALQTWKCEDTLEAT